MGYKETSRTMLLSKTKEIIIVGKTRRVIVWDSSITLGLTGLGDWNANGNVILSETKWSRNISDFAYWKNNLSLFLIYAIISNRVEVSWFLFTWWRSGNDNNYNNAYCMAPSGGDNNNHNVTTELGVRPALHSLTK